MALSVPWRIPAGPCGGTALATLLCVSDGGQPLLFVASVGVLQDTLFGKTYNAVLVKITFDGEYQKPAPTEA